MTYYRRRLPHWQPEGASIFLTWRLHGSVARTLHTVEWESLTDGQRFLLWDHELDTASTGPTYLKNPLVAATVVETFFLASQDWELCELFAWVVMSNHVHLLVKPKRPLREITRAVKSTSAREANRILGRVGLPFWKDESYDHWIRDAKEFERIRRYIELNPVKAGLVTEPELWAWSSASHAGTLAGQDLPHIDQPPPNAL